MRRCKATNAEGKQCQAAAMKDSDFCFWHNPRMAKEQAAARKKAGRNRAKGRVDPSFAEEMQGRDFRSMQDIIGLIEVGIKQTLALENSVSRNRTLGYLARSWADVYEIGELEARVEALEELVNESQA